MLRLLGVVVILAIIIGGAILVWWLVQHRIDTSEWEVRERSTGSGIVIMLVKQKEEPLVIGTAQRGERFDEDLAWFRSQAKVERDDLNRGRKLFA